eukprot:TRINITY_DN89584_c0_g1_i1.p2 TRINITY_DN89584_c0_g1~~TRINITY_DN89584_c0_g1_i1.p2  ORF type:complete len:221 (+),score=26.65 TRINITY_DN89584_c0_g1_i1:52-663(+)
MAKASASQLPMFVASKKKLSEVNSRTRWADMIPEDQSSGCQNFPWPGTLVAFADQPPAPRMPCSGPDDSPPKVDFASYSQAHRYHQRPHAGGHPAAAGASAVWGNFLDSVTVTGTEIVTFASAPSNGSLSHGAGNCRPCAWFWKDRGCRNATACTYCHLCPQDELKSRKKAKLDLLRKGVLSSAAPHPGGSGAIHKLKLAPLL